MAEIEKKKREDDARAPKPNEESANSEVKAKPEKKEPVNKPPAKKPIPKVIESETINGLVIQDYSHLYKSFYDIFVG
jgi:hypothetical protein